MTDSGQARTHRRYILIAILFVHTVNTYMDRACLSSAAGDIKADLGISDQTMGYVFGIFAIGYALFQVPAGWVADYYGPRRALAGIVAVWSTFTALTGAAFNAASMLVLRFLFGVGESGAFPGATRAFYGWVPVKERGLAQGIFHSGARLGAAVSLFFMPLLIQAIGWRLTFVANGVFGIAWGLVWWFWFRDDPADHSGVNAAELDHIRQGVAGSFTVSTKIPFIEVATSPNMILAMFQYIASNVTFFISFTWLQPYLTDHWGSAAAPLAAIPLIFAMFAHWTSGGLTMWLFGRGHAVASRRIPALAGFLLSAVGLILCNVAAPDSALAFVFFFSIAVFGVEMTVSPSWAFCMDIGGARSGAVSGSMNMLGNLGAAASAILFPWFVANVTLPVIAPRADTADSFFAFAAGLNVLAAVAWLFMNPTRKLDESPSQTKIVVRFIVFGALLALAAGAVVYTQFVLK